MTTTNSLLQLLESHRGVYLSGEGLAETLEVPRGALEKAVCALREDGHQIECDAHRGYRLSPDADRLSAQSICALLTGPASGLRVEVRECVSSTNTLLREKAQAGEPAGAVLAASAQTGGRGRMGRTFFSPADTGLYLSLLLRPTLAPERAGVLTAAAAVSVAQAIEALTGKDAGIKWVNDVLVDGRKVCGILTEGAVDLERGSFDHVIVGIGVNLFPPRDGFPPELDGVAGALFSRRTPGVRSLLAAEVLNRLCALCDTLDHPGFLTEYRRRSLVLSKPILVLRGSASRPAVALEVDDLCRLKVAYEDGATQWLSSGEVSIRPVSV